MLILLILLFILSVCLYLVCFYLMVRWLTSKVFNAHWHRELRPEPRWFRWFRSFVFILSALGVLAFLYALYVEPYWPQVSHHRIQSSEIPAKSRPIRLVHITDTHSDPEVRLEKRLPELIKGLQPDLIAFTGDAINSPEGLPNFKTLVNDLSKIAPTFAVSGNWEMWFHRGLDHYSGTKVGLLSGYAAQVNIRGTELWVLGSSVDRDDEFEKATSHIPADQFSIFLHHFPEKAAQALDYGADLALSGDTHGGQVRLPFVGALIRLDRFGTFFDMGLHRLENGYLSVSRGIGMEGGKAPRVRFLCRPEVVLIEIVPE